MIELNKSFFDHNVVFLSGLARSGKTLLCPIISSFINSEKINLEPNFENLLELQHINCIEEDSLIYLLRSQMNLLIFNDAIGRNVNFRPNDYSSVWNYVDPLTYLNRIGNPDDDNVYTNIKNSNRLFPLMLHDGLWHSDYIFKAFPSSKLIHMQRHPVDLIYSWLMKGLGGSFYNNLRSHIVTYNFKNTVLPYYAFGWEEEYSTLGEGDRVICMINNLLNEHLKVYSQLNETNKNSVLFLNHQALASNPDIVVEEVEVFLESKVTPHTLKVLEKENCPRVFLEEDRIKKLQYIKSQSSVKCHKILNNMIDNYNGESKI
jgi:hypothetical protein